MRILIVEDEKEMNRILSRRLQLENYITDSCFTGTEALNYLELADYDAVVLDMMLPELDGLSVLKTIRAKGNQVPILILSAKNSTNDIVNSLDAGADDYLVKPFDFMELLARLRLIMRKKAGIHENIYRCCDLEVDTTSMRVSRGGEQISLSPREYNILLFLIRNQNIVVSRQQIVDNIYNISQEINSNVIDVYIRLLRKKIDANYDRKLIYTIHGVGYVLKCGD